MMGLLWANFGLVQDVLMCRGCFENPTQVRRFLLLVVACTSCAQERLYDKPDRAVRIAVRQSSAQETGVDRIEQPIIIATSLHRLGSGQQAPYTLWSESVRERRYALESGKTHLSVMIGQHGQNVITELGQVELVPVVL